MQAGYWVWLSTPDLDPRAEELFPEHVICEDVSAGWIQLGDPACCFEVSHGVFEP